MEYRVELSPRAFADIDAIVGYIHQNSPENARRWRERVLTKIETLSIFPRGYSRAAEDAHCSFEVRQTFLGRYRVLFTVRDDDQLVYILTVRHSARREMSTEELDEAAEQ
jgi:plasmid stabilization system protein ParE